MIGTIIICPACNGVDFKTKNSEGDILLHCGECSHKAVLKFGGVTQGSIASLSEEKTFPSPKEKKVKEKKVVDPNAPKFVTMSPSLLDTQKDMVTAAIHACKEIRGIAGRAFSGTSLFWIAVDFLSGVNIEELSPKVAKMIEHARKVNEEKEPVNPEDIAPEVREMEVDDGEGKTENSEENNKEPEDSL